MNKFFTKIATLSVGLAMAIGVGVAIGNRIQEPKPVEAAAGDTITKTLTFTSSLYGISTTQGNQTLTGDGATYGFEFVKGTGTGAKASGSSPSSTSYILFGKAGVYFRNTSAPANSYISAISWTYASGVSTNVVLSISYGSSALTEESSPQNQPKATANGTVSLTPTDTSKSYFFIYVTNAYNCQWKSFSVTWKEKAASGFSVTYNGNGNTGGSVPTDATSYSSGATVTVKNNTGSLVKTGFTFNGWNKSADGTGDHYAAGTGTFTISNNTTLYAEWVKTLDAITAIGGTAKATISAAGTTNWDFSEVTVTGTLSGDTGQNVKTYVDLSSSTNVPSSIGGCTISVTATKKSTIPGSASSFTNNSVSGEVEAPKLTYTLVLDYTKMLTKDVSYPNENANPKSSDATCTGKDDIAISWASNQVQRPSGKDYMQFQANNGYIYNTTELPGDITNVVLTDANGNTRTFTTYYGNEEHPTSSTTMGGKFFTVSIDSGSGAGYLASITVTFQVSDKPKVQLVASDINLDVADGAATPNVTDGTSAITGYSLASGDTYIASITNDGKVQPTGYGKVAISVTKAEDAGHIYLATTFTVTVGDHSKEASVMEFAEKANGSATADDGVEWTITSNASENDFSDIYGINFGSNNAKVSSLTLTTSADEERIIKNVVVEAMSNNDGSTISVTVGSTDFVCSKSTSLIGTVSTYNFSNDGNVSGAITISISGTASSKYGVKSIAVLYVGDQATSFASTFLGAIACNNSGTSKPTFNIKTGETRWTWALLETEFGGLSAADKAKFAKNATGVSQTIVECVARYDYIVGKYFVAEVDKTLISSDFMSRSPAPVGNSRVIINTVMGSTGSTAIIIIIASAISLATIGGYFLFKKKKQN